jgi:hypothetical protein
MLTIWFEIHKTDSLARNITYPGAPTKFTLNSKEKKWKRRQRNQSGVLGRLYFVSPFAGEKFYLRLLFLHAKGAFEDFRIFNGKVCETFKEACEERALLKDDQEWTHTLTEVAAHQTCDQLLNLFGQILIFCNPSNPNQLWEDFKFHFSENIFHQIKSLYSETQSEEEIKSKALNISLI